MASNSNTNTNTNNVVVVGVPVFIPVAPVSTVDLVYSRPTVILWSTGLCDCFSDIPSCCLTLWFPCFTFGRISEIVDKGMSSCWINGALYGIIAIASIGLIGVNCAPLYSTCYRTKMRTQFSLDEDACGDCLIHCFCEYCALCQEYRELQNQGYDMCLGWRGNVERQNREREIVRTAPPIIEEGMNR